MPCTQYIPNHIAPGEDYIRYIPNGQGLINQGASDVNHIILENSPDEADNNA